MKRTAHVDLTESFDSVKSACAFIVMGMKNRGDLRRQGILL